VPPVSVDAGRILQLLSNLVANAVKFTQAGGTVTVSAASVGDDVVLSVTDTGPGISEEHLSHVFERYWHARRTTGARGSGLGLAIAKGIADAHGGRLSVESAVGRGSTFSVTLPAVRGAQSAGGT
jgi:signal transduction histidine kinase